MLKFTVHASTRLSPDQLVDEIFKIDNWSGFTGWGPLPGIERVELLELTRAKIGTRFGVTNTDESTHEETVVEYVPQQRLVMRIENFSAPLGKIADHFVETWRFDAHAGHTTIERTFDLIPKGAGGTVLLWLIGFGLQKAVQAHTNALAQQDFVKVPDLS